MGVLWRGKTGVRAWKINRLLYPNLDLSPSKSRHPLKKVFFENHLMPSVLRPLRRRPTSNRTRVQKGGRLSERKPETRQVRAERR